jgi:hypothetical protein
MEVLRMSLKLIGNGGDGTGVNAHLYGLDFGGSEAINIEPIQTAFGIAHNPAQSFDIEALKPKDFDPQKFLLKNNYGLPGLLFNAAGIDLLNDERTLDSTEFGRGAVGGSWDSGRFWIMGPRSMAPWIRHVLYPAFENLEVAIGIIQKEHKPNLFILLTRELGSRELAMIRNRFEDKSTSL